MRGNTINPALLEMSEVVSEDSVRRNFGKIDEAEEVQWLQHRLGYCAAPLLSERWILDADTTVKLLYGHQEGAVKGYNSHKPGRPSHTCHTYFLSSLRLILEVEVKAGNQTASKYSSPGLWELLGRLPRAHWPALIRGDRDWGTQANMARAEQEGVPYLFKLRMTKRVKKAVERLMRGAVWCAAGQGWQGVETRLRLEGWGRARRAIVLRRQIKADLTMVAQPRLWLFLQLGDGLARDTTAAPTRALSREVAAAARRGQAAPANGRQWPWHAGTRRGRQVGHQ